MTAPLSTIRHSASHVLAQAVLHFFPDAKLGIGPAIEEGFYYDFDLPRSLTPEDLTQIEAKMKEIIAEGQSFSHFDLDRKAALETLKKQNQPYKIELINDLSLPDYSFYKNGPFLDLCKGPHVAKTSEIGAIKLLSIAGAYWKGSEKNQMLQRIYGTAFPTEAELKAHLDLLEEAKKRDHRLLGKELELFSYSESVGTGLMLWHPKGAMLRYLIEDAWRKEHLKAGYQFVQSPHIGKSDLWQTSGHLGFYEENMFAPMEIDAHSYYVKPMNCPFHIQIYKETQHSYRELPLRWAELGTVYRYERSGVLHGLMRVRGFTQDDAHIFCRPDQLQGEIRNALDLAMRMLKLFGFTNYRIYLSTRPTEKYVGSLEEWGKAEKDLESALQSLQLNYEVDTGGGAFYGPKIDLKIEDAIGREWQCSTIQVDFNLPERFDLSYIGSDGAKHRPFMVHRALFGSIERFIGVLIEHYAGKFPVWLSPIQVKILGLNSDVIPYCESIAQTLRDQNIRVDCDFSSEKLGYKIRKAQLEKVPYMAIIGKKEAETQTLAIRSRDQGELGPLSLETLLTTIQSKKD